MATNIINNKFNTNSPKRLPTIRQILNPKE